MSNETPEMQVDSTILKLAEQRAVIDEKRKGLNEDARNINANIDKLGINPGAFMLAVRIVKGMTKGERADYLSSVRRVTKVVGERQMELYPAETKRQEEREQAKRQKAAEERTMKGPDADTNERSDPARGGAAKPKGKGKTGKRSTEEQLSEAAAAANQQAEQQEGEDALKNLTPETQAAQASAFNADGTPKSQSQLSAEKLEAAKLN